MDDSDNGTASSVYTANIQSTDSQDVYRQVWQEASQYMESLPAHEQQELRENRERGERWAEDIVSGLRDPLDGMPDNSF